MRDDHLELLFLAPLPFGGDVWERVKIGLGDVATCTPTIYSLGETMPDVAAAVLDIVEGKRLIVVGNSIGGSCALEVAIAAPDRVEHLVLIGTKAGHRAEPAYRDWALELLASEGVDALWDQVWEPLFSAATDRAVMAAALAMASTVPPDDIAAGIALFHGRRDRNHVLDRWTKPLTVIVGEHDRAPGPGVGREMAARTPHGVAEVVPACGHYVPIERPDVVARALGHAIGIATGPRSGRGHLPG